MTYREMIIDCLANANLVPRKRVVPADMLESAKRLLDGILRKYSFANFISYARDSIEVITENGAGPVVELDLPDATSISNVQYKMSDNVYADMRFVSYEQFFTDNDLYTYTWKYTKDNTIQVIFKPEFANRNVVIYYNERMNYGLDEELKVPVIYLELFTAALTYKLAITYPRLDDNRIAILKGELEEIEKTVKGLVSSNKILTRDVAAVSNLDAFMSGSFIFR